ncbi:MAG: hypothetical protein AB8B85_18465 [Paracoccaceae bacterium]
MSLSSIAEFASVAEFARKTSSLPGGVVGVVLCESDLHATASAKWLARLGTGAVIAIGPGVDAESVACPVIQIAERPYERGIAEQLNLLFGALDGRWVAWLWAGEFLIYPFYETRSLADLTAFMTDERRRSLYTYALDLYAQDLPGAETCPTEAALSIDISGYHAFPKENQQLRVFGGLGWRFQEMVPRGMEQIGRTSLFKAARSVRMDRELIFHDPDYAAVQCPWHNNPTGAVMTLRRTRRIMAHPNFGPLRERLEWRGTEPFDWTSSQLLERGMIEPGQWF